MRVSDVFAPGTPGRTDSPSGGYYYDNTGHRNYYEDYYDGGGYDNNNFDGFERGPTRPSFLGLIG
ncbi:MAG: hypothetical protein DLM62_11035 [Pseudonocardiales bacterium]|nr:MAG: hypothetical protein DLM62_11035 [Pseudonocardiales bacterium]